MTGALATEKQGILLEAGTNEFEILEYYLYDQSFGIMFNPVRLC